jgi:hypothetical protein
MSLTTAVLGWVVQTSGTPTPSPSPTGKAYPDPDTVTPGALAFVIMFVLGVAIWLLLRNLTGRLRRMRYREEQRVRAEQLALAEAEDQRWADEQAAKAAARQKGTGPDVGAAAGDAPDQRKGPGSPTGTA